MAIFVATSAWGVLRSSISSRVYYMRCEGVFWPAFSDLSHGWKMEMMELQRGLAHELHLQCASGCATMQITSMEKGSNKICLNKETIFT